MQAQPIEFGLSPEEALAAWPRGEPVAALISGRAEEGAPDSRARWSILARPAFTTRLGGDKGGEGALQRLDDMLKGTSAPGRESGGPPFRGGWIGYVSYEMGREIEGRAQHAQRPRPRGPWPLMEWHRCPDAYVFDAAERQWWLVGDRAGLPRINDLEAARHERDGDAALKMEPLSSLTGRAEFERQVARAVELIHAGDVFQVNLAHRLTGSALASARGLYLRLAAEARPWYGAYLESEHSAIVSLSPELFLEFDAATRRVVTRPMKGTRAAAAGRESLLESEKDAAELNMIVDLMRNDLGRVCEFGTVKVEEGRVVERHGGDKGEACAVLQGVATVSGRVREGIGVAGLLRATFPPGSVTGAPKIRAMQIIDELEPVERGPYCGAIGYISDHGHAAMSVAIRTALATWGEGEPGRPGGAVGAQRLCSVSYSVGAGIVADSRPADEWRETLVKAGALVRLAGLAENEG